MSSTMNPDAELDADFALEFDFDAMEINPDADDLFRLMRNDATPETSGHRCLDPIHAPGLPVSMVPF